MSTKNKDGSVRPAPPPVSEKPAAAPEHALTEHDHLRNVALEEHAAIAHQTGVGDPAFWLGKQGVAHNFGTGIVKAFIGPQAGQAVGDIFGSLEDAGMEALNKRQ